MNDVIFYDFDFNLLYILPPFAVDTGYISANATAEFCGDGSFELVFDDDGLKRIIESKKDEIIVKWGKFEGFLTGFKWEDDKSTVFGMSLSGLLHRVVFPPATALQTNNRTAEYIVRDMISQNCTWLNLGDEAGFTAKVEFQSDKYQSADVFVSDCLKLDNGGFEIYADFTNKKFMFRCLKRAENELIISENLLNAYNFTTTYTNKELAFGGWYEEEYTNGDGEAAKRWKYISTAEKTGIRKIDTVLSSNTKAEAEKELKRLNSQYDIEAETKDLIFGTSYKLGDIVRLQSGNVTVKKVISSVDIWQEETYGEMPKFNDLEE